MLFSPSFRGADPPLAVGRRWPPPRGPRLGAAAMSPVRGRPAIGCRPSGYRRPATLWRTWPCYEAAGW